MSFRYGNEMEHGQTSDWAARLEQTLREKLHGENSKWRPLHGDPVDQLGQAVRRYEIDLLTHEVTNSGSDRAQLANMATQAKAVLGVDKLEAVADRGYYSGEEIKACEDADIAVTLPKPATSGMEAKGQFGKHDFVYLSDDDAYRCPAGEVLSYHSATVDDGRAIRRYWTRACVTCPLKARCTKAKHRVISRWEHEHVMEAAQKRLDENPQAMRSAVRRSSIRSGR